MTRRPARFAVLASFAVYLLPVAGPHFVSLWGLVLWQELIRFRRAPGWLATDIALALALQLLTGLLLFVILHRGSRWRLAWMLVAAPAIYVTLEWAYMAAIPAFFLIDEDSSPELRDWPAECTVADAVIVPVRSGVELALEKSEVAWIARGARLSETALLSMPDCNAREIHLDSPHAGGGLQWASPEGAAFFTRWDPVAGVQSYWYLSLEGEEEELEPPPELQYWSPVLSTDGTALAWVSQDRHAIVLHPMAGPESRIVLPESIRAIRGGLELVSFDVHPMQLTLSTSDGEVFAVDEEGHTVWGPNRLDAIENPSGNFRRLGDGWVAWDVYREEGPYRVVWSLPEGDGEYDVPKGRSITSVTVEPSGHLIGVSVSPAYNIGSVRDAVFVFRTKDAHEVFRRYLPPYSRSAIAFLGPRFFAMNLYEEEQNRIAVLRVPREN